MFYRFFNFLVCSLLLINGLLAQNEIAKDPFLLDKSVLSGVGLKQIEMKNEPGKIFHQKKLFGGKDISVYVVSTNTYRNTMDKFPFDEFVYMFHGEAVVTPTNGSAQLFKSGDYFFAPQGFSGEWEIRVGNQLHYELSIISTKRNPLDDSRLNDEHTLLSTSRISGAHIKFDENNEYSEILQEGNELTILLKAEKPKSKVTFETRKDVMIQLLAGQVTMETSSGEKQFYTGDFFVIPAEYKGNWTSEGHGLVKFIQVEKS